MRIVAIVFIVIVPSDLVSAHSMKPLPLVLFATLIFGVASPLVLSRTKPAAPAAAAAGPVIVLETAKGDIEIETYPEGGAEDGRPRAGLVKKNFYNGQRFHRAEPGFVIQIGDPQTRDMTKQASWGHRQQRHAGRRRRDLEEAQHTAGRGRHGARRRSAKSGRGPVLHHAARGADARRQVRRLRQGDQRARRCGEDSKDRRAQEGFREGMSVGIVFTSPFRSG